MGDPDYWSETTDADGRHEIINRSFYETWNPVPIGYNPFSVDPI